MTEENPKTSNGGDEEPPPGLLERSAIQDGKRERKKTERLSVTATDEREKRFEIPEGKGTKLGDCPRIDHNLTSYKADELKGLHKLLFKTPGQIHTLKKNIRKFNGFAFDSGSPEQEKKSQQLNKMMLPELKKICLVLDLERSGAKETIVERILQFLLQPSDSGRSVPKKKSKKRKSESKGAADAGKIKKTKKKTKKKNTDEDLVDDDDISASSGAEDDDDKEEEKEEEDRASDEESEPEKKKKKKSAPPKANGVKEKKEKAKKKVTPAKKVTDDDISPDESDSDDEPLAAKKKTIPTDKEIKQTVEEVLKDADLDTVTMKLVFKDVAAKYPDFDLSSKKDFIKATVKKIIS